MAPIRVGIIGLSAEEGSWGRRAHLPYLQNSSKYKITAVCNSSLASSEKAIQTIGLEDAKAYGSPADLAASEDVDLVVCTVRVDRHYDAIKPAIAAGKDCFVEWPLASTPEQARELLQLAEQKGIRTMIGLQGRMSPVISRIKDLIEKEKVLGRILSSSIVLAGALGSSKTTEAIKYVDQLESGGNMLVIPVGHLYDSVSYTLGELESVSATLSTQHRELPIMSGNGSEKIGTIHRTTADHVAFSGLLVGGAQSSTIVYGGEPFEGEPGFIWRIEGEEGVLDIRGQQTFAISMSGSVKIRLQRSSTVEDIDFEVGQPGPVGNIARLYEAFAEGQYHPTWKEAVTRHAWVDALYRSQGSGKRESYL